MQRAYETLKNPKLRENIIARAKSGISYRNTSADLEKEKFYRERNFYSHVYEQQWTYGKPVDPKTVRGKNIVYLFGLLFICFALNMFLSPKIQKIRKRQLEEGNILLTAQDLKEIRLKQMEKRKEREN